MLINGIRARLLSQKPVGSSAYNYTKCTNPPNQNSKYCCDKVQGILSPE